MISPPEKSATDKHRPGCKQFADESQHHHAKRPCQYGYRAAGFEQPQNNPNRCRLASTIRP